MEQCKYDCILQGMIPRNRMRSTTSSMICSRCTSVLSVNQYSRATSRCTSQISLHHLPSFNRKSSCKSTAEESPVFCKICLVEYHPRETHKIWQCNCLFCQEVTWLLTPVSVLHSQIVFYFFAVPQAVFRLWDYGWSLRNQLPRLSMRKRIHFSTRGNWENRRERLDRKAQNFQIEYR